MTVSSSTNVHLTRANRDEGTTITDYVRADRLGGVELDPSVSPERSTFSIKLGQYPAEVTVFVNESDLQRIADIFTEAAFKAHLQREGVVAG